MSKFEKIGFKVNRNGFGEIASGNYKELKYIEQQFIEPNDSVYVYSEIVRNAKNGNITNNSIVKDGGEYEQSRRPLGNKRLQNDTAGNDESSAFFVVTFVVTRR